jgi:outer membrane receptor protein involved in Fe transport
VISISAPAFAQESTETVVVTGSRIPQTGLYSSSPVTAVGQQELKLEGTTDVTTLLNNLPEAFVDQNSGVSNGASGTANVDLRGLGSKRTLVLVNGSRLMPGDISDPVADLNDIPAALVDHVEVLTGGASAVYGSDALAGVVNFIMRKDFEGVEFDGTYTVTQNDNTNGIYRAATQIPLSGGAYGFAQSPEDIWNGEGEDATLVLGTNTANDKGNVTAYVGYRHTAAVLEASRDFSECTLASTGSGVACSGSSNYDRFLSYDNLFHDIGAYYGLVPGTSSHPYDFFETPDNGHAAAAPPGGQFTGYTGANSQHFNYGGLNYLQRPDTRYTGGFFGHYEVNKQLDIYSSFMFSDDHTVGQIAPSGLFLGSGTGYSNTQYINCGNPLMSAQENSLLCGQLPGDALVTVGTHTFWNGAGNMKIPLGPPGEFLNPGAIPGQAELEIGRRDIEGGNRQDDLRHTAYRMQVGAKGDLGDGWSYDVYGQYGLTVYSENYQNEFSKARVQNALEVDPATGECYSKESVGGLAPTDPNCVPLNIFDGTGSITPDMLGYVKADGLKEGFTQEQIVSGSVTGDLGKWGGQSPWAKSPIGVSIGGEYRQEDLKLVTDQEFTTNDLYGQGSATFSVPESGYNVREGFTEVSIPLVQNMPFFQDLTLNGGYRYSSYNIAGSTSTYKYGAEWQPIDDFRIRASVNRAVRAPNVLELFSPTNVVLFGGQDPCAFTNAGRCSTVPNAGNSVVLECPATQCDQKIGGNINLKPEVSDTRSAGIVLTPTFISGFTATVDWFDIRVNQFISTLGANNTLSECYGPDATAQSEAFFCPLVARNGTGQIWGSGYVNAPTVNTGYLSTKGVDVEVNYQTDLSDWGMGQNGSLSFNLIGTWLDTLTTEPVPINALLKSIDLPYNCAGLYGQTCGTPNPKWRHKLRVTWSSPWDVDFSVAWRYIGEVGLDADTTNGLVGGGPGATTCGGRTIHGVGDCWDSRINAFNYFDLAASWTVREGVELRAGVNNVFDKDPPVIGTSQLPVVIGNGNTFPGEYDALGRTVFLSATIKN